MEIYCLKCKKKTPNIGENTTTITTKRGPRKVMDATCKVCGSKKSRFMSMGSPAKPKATKPKAAKPKSTKPKATKSKATKPRKRTTKK